MLRWLSLLAQLQQRLYTCLGISQLSLNILASDPATW